MSKVKKVNKKDKSKGFLGWVERTGNKLPHSAIVFTILFFILTLITVMGYYLGWKSIDSEGKEYTVMNFYSNEGMRWFMDTMIPNFIEFPPLGTVLLIMLGIGVAEESGLIASTIKVSTKKATGRSAAYLLAFLGIISNIASDSGYIVLIPLGGLLFYSLGKHPLAGIAVAFASVSAGFSANLIVGPTDALLVGISEKVPNSVNHNVMQNWYFLMASTFLLSIIIGLVSNYIVEPALGEYKGKPSTSVDKTSAKVSKRERNALWWVFGFTLVSIGITVAMGWPGVGPFGFKELESGGWVKADWAESLLMQLIIPILFLYFTIAGIIFGFMTKKFKKSGDVIGAMSRSMSGMGGYIALSFFMAQFIALFDESNLGTIMSIHMGQAMGGTKASPIWLFLLFMIFTSLMNLFNGSASAKWALLAPMMIPMLHGIYGGQNSGYDMKHLEAGLLMSYRIADSTSNIISPLMIYLPIIINFAKSWDSKAGLGTIMRMMIPYSVIIFIAWSIMFIIWFFIPNLPFGIYT